MMADRLSDIAAGGDSTKKLIKVMDADLGCCLDCAIEYHRNRAAWLRSNPIAALPKRLYKRDVSRLTRQLQDFSSRCDDGKRRHGAPYTYLPVWPFLLLYFPLCLIFGRTL